MQRNDQISWLNNVAFTLRKQFWNDFFFPQNLVRVLFYLAFFSLFRLLCMCKREDILQISTTGNNIFSALPLFLFFNGPLVRFHGERKWGANPLPAPAINLSCNASEFMAAVLSSIKDNKHEKTIKSKKWSNSFVSFKDNFFFFQFVVDFNNFFCFLQNFSLTQIYSHNRIACCRNLIKASNCYITAAHIGKKKRKVQNRKAVPHVNYLRIMETLIIHYCNVCL